MLTDAEFLEAFRARTLSSDEFNHVGHIRAGWLYLAAWPTVEAIERLATDIQGYASALGAERKFHRTITEALMRLLASHLPDEADLGWRQLIERHPVVVHDARGLLRNFYSDARLADSRARTQFLAPDLKPLPAHR